jgi:hypothetical protein
MFLFSPPHLIISVGVYFALARIITQKNRTDLHLFSKPIYLSKRGKLKRHSIRGKTWGKYIPTEIECQAPKMLLLKGIYGKIINIWRLR